jgi:hypothetical protein
MATPNVNFDISSSATPGFFISRRSRAIINDPHRTQARVRGGYAKKNNAATVIEFDQLNKPATGMSGFVG